MRQRKAFGRRVADLQTVQVVIAINIIVINISIINIIFINVIIGINASPVDSFSSYQDSLAAVLVFKRCALWKFSLFQHKLAEVKTSIAVARAFTDQCMELHQVANAFLGQIRPNR